MIGRHSGVILAVLFLLAGLGWAAAPAGAAVPYCTFSYSPGSPIPGDTVNFSSSGSYDPDGKGLVWAQWDFGDGSYVIGFTAQHEYAAPGTYNVCLTLRDWDSETNTCCESLVVHVTRPPTCSVGMQPPHPFANQPVNFTANAYDSDGTVVSIEWTLGDGATASGPALRHTYTAAGSYTVTCTVTDDSGEIGQCGRTVTVEPACPPRTITTIAGIGIAGYEGGGCPFPGDGGPASSACLNWPAGIARAADGSLYIADMWNHRIRKIAPDGTITTVAGNGTAGFSGDGGLATSAQLDTPMGVALGSSGSFYIADTGNNRIRYVDFLGNIGTIAGTGVGGYSGDGGPAISAQLNLPRAMAGSMDGLLIADYLNHRVRLVDGYGDIWTVAGTGVAGYSGDGGDPRDAQLWGPSGVTSDGMGGFYIADLFNDCIRKVDAVWGGTITTVAGTGIGGYSGDGGPATSARLYEPWSVLLRPDGSFYIADGRNHRIRKVDAGGIITTVAGNGTAGFSGDGGPATDASLDEPHGMVMDSLDILYIVDTRNHRIRRVCPSLPPACDITYSPGEPVAGEQVDFDSDAYDQDGGAVVWVDWEFGDGGTGTGVTVSHAYLSTGTYSVTCTVTDDEDESASCSTTVTVAPSPPTAAFTWTPASPAVGSVVEFDSTSSSDPDGTIVAWWWDFGDGGTSTDQNPTHAYAAGGCFQATLTVTDSDGLSDSVTHCVPVRSPTEMPLCDAGWHMVSPYCADYALADITVRDDANGGSLGFCDAVGSWVMNPLFYYDTDMRGYGLCGCDGVPPPTTDHTLRMGYGYWLYTFQDYLTLVFP